MNHYMTRQEWEEAPLKERIKLFKLAVKNDPEYILEQINRICSTRKELPTFTLTPDRQIIRDPLSNRVSQMNIDEFAEIYVESCDNLFRPIMALELFTNELIEQFLRMGIAFQLDENIDYNMSDRDGSSLKNLATLSRSIFSYLWGPHNEFRSADINDKFYTCSCTKSEGLRNVNLVCPECRTVVKRVDYPVDTLGFFKSNRRIITYPAYLKINDILGTFGRKMVKDEEGNLISRATTRESILDYILKLAKTSEALADPAKGGDRETCEKIKMFRELDLYDNLELLFSTFLKKAEYDKKKDKIDFVIRHKNKLFLNYIPVISTAFRKTFIKELHDGVHNIIVDGTLNNSYISLSTALKEMHDYSYSTNNKKQQQYYLTVNRIFIRIAEEIYDNMLHGKEKYIRSAVLGRRQDMVVMGVLSPLTRGLRECDSIIGYDMYRSLFPDEIEEWMVSMGHDFAHISKILDIDEVLSIDDKKLLKEHLRYNLAITNTNRQPTVMLSSNVATLIVDLHDANTMLLHPVTFAKLQADCDGDALSQKGLNKANGLAFKYFFRQGSFNYNLDFKGDLDTMGLPDLDIGFINKLSIPTIEYGGKEAVGVYHKKEIHVSTDVNNEEVIEKLVHIKKDYDLGNHYHSLNDYFSRLEKELKF